MKALVCTAPGVFNYIEIEKPQLDREGHSLLKIISVGICGTDYHAYEGTQPYFNYPRILGHEIAAEIVQTGEESGFNIGELVTISPYFYCGKCIACRNGKTNCCEDIRVGGVHVDGAMTEYISVPDHHIIAGNGLSADELVLVEPLAIGAHGIRRAMVQPGEFVLVIGAGPIGLGTMNFARIAGAQVIALDVNAQRLAFCADKFDLEYTINGAQEDVIKRLKEITNGDMPTVVIDCSGNLKAINGAVYYMAHGARFVMIGLQKQDLVISHPEFHKREATLMSSRNALPADFQQVITSIKNGLVKPEDYITHKVKFEDVKNKFTSLNTADSGVIKAIIDFK